MTAERVETALPVAVQLIGAVRDCDYAACDDVSTMTRGSGVETVGTQAVSRGVAGLDGSVSRGQWGKRKAPVSLGGGGGLANRSIRRNRKEG